MANWQPLRERLAGVDELTMSWPELDALVGGLPASAYRHAAFWGGDRPTWVGFRTRDVRVGLSVTFVCHDRGSAARRPAADPRVMSLPALDLRASSTPDVILISCVKRKQNKPAPAKDLYVSSLFRMERAYAERSCVPWFILSAEHGLVQPDQVLEPYDVRLSTTSADYRRVWGVRVVRRLAELADGLEGKAIEIHAGAAYADPIRELLRSTGAAVEEPLAGLRHGERLAWYTRARALPQMFGTRTPIDVSEYVAVLRDVSSAHTPEQFLATHGDGLRTPGLYSWWVDSSGAADLSRGIHQEIRPGLIYAGLAGATRERSGKRSSNTLWLRIGGMHLGGRYEFSTLRLTLGSALASSFGWNEIKEQALTSWMHLHLRVVALPVLDADTLGSVETAILDELDPPLNLSQMAKSDVRRRLSALRRQYGRKNRATHPND